MKKPNPPSSEPARSRRVKCACASCVCTVDMDKAVRRGNLLFCSETCAAGACTLEECRCECNACSG